MVYITKFITCSKVNGEKQILWKIKITKCSTNVYFNVTLLYQAVEIFNIGTICFDMNFI